MTIVTRLRSLAVLRPLASVAAGAVLLLGGAAPARAQAVQISPLAAWGFGGSVRDLATGEERSFDASPVFGGAVDVKIGEGWNVEGYYSRQSTRLDGGLAPSFDVALERYLLGIQQETGTNPNVRWFGTFWLGATRFIPGLDSFGSETKFTGGLELGVKTFLTKNFGLRFEARGFYTLVKGEGGLLCVNGACLFAFSGSGLWQGDIGGGLVFAF